MVEIMLISKNENGVNLLVVDRSLLFFVVGLSLIEKGNSLLIWEVEYMIWLVLMIWMYFVESGEVYDSLGLLSCVQVKQIVNEEVSFEVW